MDNSNSVKKLMDIVKFLTLNGPSKTLLCAKMDLTKILYGDGFSTSILLITLYSISNLVLILEEDL